MAYELTISKEQAIVIKEALEEYFRLRMGQFGDFCDEMAQTGFKYDKTDPNNTRNFAAYIERRGEAQALFDQAMRIARSGDTRPYTPQTTEMLRAQDIWQVLRYQLYLDNGGDPNGWSVEANRPWSRSGEKLPEIQRRNENE